MTRTKFVAFREDETIINLIKKVAINQGIDRSDFIRQAVRKCLAEMSFLSEDQKKALGVREDK